MPEHHLRTGPAVNVDDLRDRVNTVLLQRGTLHVAYPTRDAPAEIVGARHVSDLGPTELHEYVTVLCWPTMHAERYDEWRRNFDGSRTLIRRRHITTSPPLLVQLVEAVEQSGSAEDGGLRPVFGSKPSARLEAIDAAQDIERGVFGWLTQLGERPDSMVDSIAGLRRVGALAVSQTKPTQLDIEADVRGWWARASVLTGWEAPAWQPNNTCPLCGTRGSLRVRLSTKTATCHACHEAWWPDTLGLLAEHIRYENDLPREAQHHDTAATDRHEQTA